MSDAVVQRLEAVASRLESLLAKKSGGGGGDEKESAVVGEYQDYLNQYLTPFLATCSHFDGLQTIATQADSSFKFVKTVIEAQTQCKKPDQNSLQKFIAPLADAVSAASKTDNRSPFFNHQKAWSEAIQVHNWIFTMGPVAAVQGVLESSEFYLNKVLGLAKDANDADKKAHRDFVAQVKALINNLVPFLQNNFKMGLNWNPKGGDLLSFSSGGASSAPAAPAVPPGGAAPPPPPPVDPSVVISATAPGGDAGGGDKKAPGGMAAVFSALNKGTDITTGLKKVTNDMKSKNMKDVPVLEAKAAAAPVAAVKAPVKEVKKEPKLELRQGTWFCENFENQEVEIKECQMKQNVYIFNCNNAVVRICDKVKSVQVDKCNKTGIVFSTVVSTFEIVNSKRVTVQVLESCPSVSVDKTAGLQLILTADSVKEPPQIITSNATELNLVVPGANAEADPIELPLPEQFLTTFVGGKVVTEPIKHSGN